MKLIVLGSGGTIPTIRRNLPAFLLKRGGESFLFDCGEGTQRQLMKSKAGFGSLSNIFISHLHVDHVSGLIGFLMTLTQMNFDKSIYLWGPSGIKNYINGVMESLKLKLNYQLTINEIQPGLLIEEDKYTISAFKLNHSITTYGFEFTEKPRPGKFNVSKAIEMGLQPGPAYGKLQSRLSITMPDGLIINPEDVLSTPRKGRKVVVAIDTAISDNFSTNISDADLLVFDGMFSSELTEEARLRKHSTAKEAARFAEENNVKHLLLTHISPRYKNLDTFIEDCSDRNIKISFASDLLDLPINYPDEESAE